MPPKTYTDTSGPGAAVLSEDDRGLSRDNVTIASGSGVVAPNTILGKVTATNEYTPWDPTADDGSETAAAMTIYGGDATDDAVIGPAIVRLAQLKEPEIVFPGTATAPQVTAMKAALADAAILVR